MPFAALVRLTALAVLSLATLAGRAQAQGPEGTYFSVDDYRLMDAGLIVPILEFVEIDHRVFGGESIEVGYQRMLPDPQSMMEMLAWSIGQFGVAADSLGRLDLRRTSRVALSADLEIADDALTWSPEYFTMTSHEPGRLPRDQALRPSPFLLATEAAQDGPGLPSLAYRLDGDMLRVTGPDGTEHSYRRQDPGLPRTIGLIALMQEISIAANHECLRPIAETLAVGEPLVFSDRAVDAMRDWAEQEGPEAAATWAEMERRGLGALERTYYETTMTAMDHSGAYLEALIARVGGLSALMERWDGMTVLDRTDGQILSFLTRFFYFSFDYEIALAPPFESPIELLEILEPQYRADPFSVVSPFVAVYLDRDTGWISQLDRLMRHELALRCPDVSPWE